MSTEQKSEKVELDPLEEGFSLLGIIEEPRPLQGMPPIPESLSFPLLENELRQWILEHPLETKIFSTEIERYKLEVRRIVKLLKERPEIRARLGIILRTIDRGHY